VNKTCPNISQQLNVSVASQTAEIILSFIAQQSMTASSHRACIRREACGADITDKRHAL
jgi:hypothetical protein